MGNTNDLVDQYKNMNIDETKEKVFVLLGLTGVGKSSFINGITNTQKCEIGHNAKSCTKNIQMVNTLLNGINYYIIDTPGFDDSKLDEEKINSTLQELRNYQRIGSILICLKYNDSKLSKSVKKALIGIMDIFPAEDFWEHTLIIRTWSQLSEDKLENHKNKYNGMLLKGINEDKELKDYMEKKNIKPP
jgi:ribosome biogenesis GTPase A